MRNINLNFDEFIEWLKKDGLKPTKSERLWKKRIFENLNNKEKKTIANYEDFLIEQSMKNKEKDINYISDHIDMEIKKLQNIRYISDVDLMNSDFSSITKKLIKQFTLSTIVNYSNDYEQHLRLMYEKEMKNEIS